MGTIITAILLVLVVGIAITKMILNYRKGKRHLGCGGDCSSCNSICNHSDKT